MTIEAAFFSKQPYRRRTWIRQRLPFFVLGLSPKGIDCESKGGSHEWYNADNVRSACYHCLVVREEQLWPREGQDQ